jgi:hypothetical protein
MHQERLEPLERPYTHQAGHDDEPRKQPNPIVAQVDVVNKEKEKDGRRGAGQGASEPTTSNTDVFTQH